MSEADAELMYPFRGHGTDVPHVGEPTANMPGAPVTTDRNAAEILDKQACLDLLAGASVGRLGLSIDALPAIFPVHFGLWDNQLLVSLDADSKLDAALRRTVVAFQADGNSEATLPGWSVLVRGMAEMMTEPDRIRDAESLGLWPWGVEGPCSYCTIETALVTGRRFPSAPNP